MTICTAYNGQIKMSIANSLVSGLDYSRSTILDVFHPFKYEGLKITSVNEIWITDGEYIDLLKFEDNHQVWTL
jgi:hypothetical protein